MTSIPAPEPVGAPRRRPTERFLGTQEASGGPFALLGLSPAQCTDELVVAALERQLARVAEHIERDTPEADEVRLALHAAAAQLLDPVVRAQLIARWAPKGGAPPTDRPAPPPPVPEPGRAHASVMLEHDVILALGLFGGWNRRTLRRLLSLAHRRGLTARDAVEAISRITRLRARAAPPPRAPEGFGMARGAGVSAPAPRTPAPPGPTAPSASSPGGSRLRLPEPPPPLADDLRPGVEEAFPEEIDPFVVLVKRAVMVGAAVLLVMGMALTVIFVVLRAPSGPAPGAPSSAGPAPAPPSATSPDKRFSAQGALAEAPKPEPAAPERAVVDPAVLTRELAACAEGLKVAPDEAAARFEKALVDLARQWPSMTRESLVSAHDSVVEFIYRSATSPAMTDRAVRAIAAPAAIFADAYSASRTSAMPPPDAVAPAIWSVGMLVRLSREPDLHASAKAAIESALAAALGPARPAIDPSFESGAAAAVLAAPRILIAPAGMPAPAGAAADPESWRRWVRCAGAASGGEAGPRSRLILAGIEALMLEAPDPSADKSVLAAIGELSASLTWRAEEESRARLLRWFDDKRLSGADLNAVTAAIATRSSAEGVDLTMVLSPVASDRARGDLRDRYAIAWGVGQSVDKDALAVAWAAAAREALAASFDRAAPVECLRQAAILSRLSEAAAWRWRGDAGAADKIVHTLVEPVDRAVASVARSATRSAATFSGDGAWGEKYLAARRNIPLRLDLLQKLGKSGGNLGPVDAEILAAEAFTGSPAEVKQRATELVGQFSASPAVVNAALELLPRMPVMIQNSKLIESMTARALPGVRDPKWAVAARRALVERLMEQLAAGGEYAAVDALSALLAVSYQGRNAQSSASVDPNKAPPPHAGAAQQYIALREQAEKVVPAQGSPVRLDLVERRRAGRFGQAEGMVQAFAAEQVSICDVMAYLTAAERPGRIDQIRLILANLAQERRGSSNILEQIRACERAMVQLWLVRLGEDTP